MEVVISENESFISIHVKQPKDISLGWEELQGIKDKYYPELDFIEVYPKNVEIINQANERHLVHIVGWSCVKMGDLEKDSKITIRKI